MSRPRLHRLLHHLAGVLCLVFVDPGPPLHQADVDNRPASLVRTQPVRKDH
jgi:hypothetical protein